MCKNICTNKKFAKRADAEVSSFLEYFLEIVRKSFLNLQIMVSQSTSPANSMCSFGNIVSITANPRFLGHFYPGTTLKIYTLVSKNQNDEVGAKLWKMLLVSNQQMKLTRKTIHMLSFKQIKNSAFFGAYNLLDRIEKKKVILITIVQTFLTFLDLFGVVIVGALGALSVQGIESHQAGNKVNTLLKLFMIQNMPFQSQIAILGVSAAFVLIIKTGISMHITRKVFYFFGNKSAKISSDLISKILSLGLVELRKRNSQEILYISSTGVKNIMIGVLATTLNVIADISILVVISISLFFVDPGIALAAVSLFSLAGISLHFLLQVRAKTIGVEEYKLTVRSNQKILEVLNSYRESVVRNRREFYSREIRKQRIGLGNLTAELNFQPFVSKYVIESALVIGSLGLAGYEFGTKNAVYAVSILAVFMAASSRIAPAALRIQQSILVIKNSSGSSLGTLQLIRELSNIQGEASNKDLDYSFRYPEFAPKVEISNASFRYSKEEPFFLREINLEIPAGSSIAIVGPSGAGKSTLIDLILGILEPETGTIEISGVTPSMASKIWPGSISYVPQEITLIEGSVRENVGQGFPLEVATDELVWNVLKMAQLEEAISLLPGKLESNVGEAGAKFSGGQRQRLGIARALFTSPKLLVMDESTSALDGQTELELGRALSQLAGNVTTIVVAHRLSTVRSANIVVYLEQGKIIAVGSFEEVRNQVPNFDKQAKLMGL
jgi:ABC-type multidrug transport system fused ATPase/permease subunit